ncbi:MAG TPA: hypothetical protein VK505_07980, partial [Steroidobacteraceae bacterium]|nr:hypothetical protein [Steroidobacteraceae bacterium]
RMGQVQYQSNRNHAAVRAFFIKYQDRLLYGTDLTQQAGSDPAAMRKEAHERWRSDWMYLATGQRQMVDDLKGTVPGLALPATVIDKIYDRNAERWFTGAWGPAAERGGT